MDVNCPLIDTVDPTMLLTNIASPEPLSAASPGTIPVVELTVNCVLPLVISPVKFIDNGVPPGVLATADTCVPVLNAAG